MISRMILFFLPPFLAEAIPIHSPLLPTFIQGSFFSEGRGIALPMVGVESEWSDSYSEHDVQAMLGATVGEHLFVYGTIGECLRKEEKGRHVGGVGSLLRIVDVGAVTMGIEGGYRWRGEHQEWQVAYSIAYDHRWLSPYVGIRYQQGKANRAPSWGGGLGCTLFLQRGFWIGMMLPLDVTGDWSLTSCFLF
ncbi:MAG: hypothetical protein VXZ72_03220 [Chlamydiota bacterium]|nr:hypothetical protein [Chlamydiota bacterium]